MIAGSEIHITASESVMDTFTLLPGNVNKIRHSLETKPLYA
jgi:hypothetical protein